MTTCSHPFVEQRLSLPVRRLRVGNATEEAVTTLALALRQIAIKIIALQWIFAFVVFGMFLAVSLYHGSGSFIMT
jgi:hypothetical protein